MKRFIIILIIISFCFEGNSQDKNPQFPFNEVVVSLNKSTDAYGKTGYYRFGLGMNRSFRDSNQIGFIAGIQYNRTSQYVTDFYNPKIHGFSSQSEATYIFNAITIPVSWRFKIGKPKRFFVELGSYIDILFASNKTARHSGFQLSPSDSAYVSFDYIKKEKIQGSPQLGFSFGIGYTFPIGTQEFLIKLDGKLSVASIKDWSRNAFLRSEPTSANNSYYQLTIGYRFNKNLDNYFRELSPY